jgi:hypothetical protein
MKTVLCRVGDRRITGEKQGELYAICEEFLRTYQDGGDYWQCSRFINVPEEAYGELAAAFARMWDARREGKEP